MWDGEYEISLRDTEALTEQKGGEHELSGVTMNEARGDDDMAEQKNKQSEVVIELKKIKSLVAMILVVLICFCIVMLFK
jgi:hypothetical protein